MIIKIFEPLSTYYHPKIVEAVEQAIDDLPPSIRDLVGKHTIQIGQTMAQIIPDANSRIARGWENLSQNHTYGLYQPKTNTISLSQARLDELCGAQNTLTPAEDNIYLTTLHELGHAFCHAQSPDPSQSLSFKRAYTADLMALKSMPARQRDLSIYYMAYFLSTDWHEEALQTSPYDAREEVFAEAFSLLIGGTGHSHMEYMEESFLKTFPHSIKATARILRKFDKTVKLYPAHKRNFKAIDPIEALSRAQRDFLNHSQPIKSYAAKAPATAISTVLAANTAIKFSAT